MKTLCVLSLFLLPLTGCMTSGGVAKALEAAGPPKTPGIVTLEITGWNTHIKYHRDTSCQIGNTNGTITVVPTTTFKVQ